MPGQAITLALLSAIATFIYSCDNSKAANQPFSPDLSPTAEIQVEASPAKPEASSPQPLASQPEAIAQASTRSGQFVGANHDTQGTARIVTENGQRYLELDSEFRTDRGPDLFVLLHRQTTPQSYQSAEYVSLGRLQQTNGAQRYLIPGDIDPAQFKSAVIWCRRYNVTFGYAPFAG